MGTWASLFSGGKDSSFALHRATETGRPVSHLVTVHPPADSFMYHVPATRLATLAAESAGLPLREVEADLDATDVVDSAAQGDRELAPLETALGELAETTDLVGVTAGAVESEYQTSRIRAMADRLGLECYAPLWQREPRELADAMLDAGFEIRIVRVAAAGLDETWLGRTLDEPALDELERLQERHGVHVLGEGGEYETLDRRPAPRPATPVRRRGRVVGDPRGAADHRRLAGVTPAAERRKRWLVNGSPAAGPVMKSLTKSIERNWSGAQGWCNWQHVVPPRPNWVFDSSPLALRPQPAP